MPIHHHYAKNLKTAKRNARIKRRLNRGWSRKQVAEHFGLTVSRIDQIKDNPNSTKVESRG